MKIKILLQTQNYIIVHKPHGFVVYADTKADEKLSLQILLQEQTKKKITPVHRLDKTTCGVIVYALNAPAAARLKQMFQTQKVHKKYLALCHAEILENMRIDTPLKKHKEKKMESAITLVEKEAVISLKLRDEDRKYSLVKCSPETGRYHQIRRHLKAAKHPIVGDDLYGNSWNNEAFHEEFHIDRTLLSAISIAFTDPWSKQKVEIKTKPDFDFANLLNKLSLKV